MRDAIFQVGFTNYFKAKIAVEFNKVLLGTNFYGRNIKN